MKVHLIRKETVEDFANKNAQSRVRVSLAEWLTKVKNADWEKPSDIQLLLEVQIYLAKNLNRAVFDIGGNKYRMICKYAYGEKQVQLFICWMGTHAEYDELCNYDDQYTVSIY